MTGEASHTERAAFLAGIAAFLIWAAHFVAIYGVGAVLCSAQATRDATFDPERVFVLVATAAAVLAMGIVLARILAGSRASPNEAASFGRRLAAASCVLSIIAVLWQALPAILIPACT